MTQPVPFWGSPVRLALPVPVAAIILGPGGGLGAFGGHQGGHTEGLNHVWIPTAPGTTVRSWADGTVTKIEAMGPRSPGSAVHEYFITIDYGQGLAGKHLDWSLPGSKRQVEGSWSAPDGPGTLIVTLRARRRIWVRTRWRSDSCRR